MQQGTKKMNAGDWNEHWESGGVLAYELPTRRSLGLLVSCYQAVWKQRDGTLKTNKQSLTKFYVKKSSQVWVSEPRVNTSIVGNHRQFFLTTSSPGVCRQRRVSKHTVLHNPFQIQLYVNCCIKYFSGSLSPELEHIAAVLTVSMWMKM